MEESLLGLGKGKAVVGQVALCVLDGIVGSLNAQVFKFLLLLWGRKKW